MNKKFFISLSIILSIIFSFSICFAETNNKTSLGNMVNGVRNFVSGTENTIENVASDVSNTSKNMTGDFENTMSGNHNTNTTEMNNNNKITYSTARTATQTNNPTVLGMTSNAWTWLILGIAAIGIITIVWYYSTQFTNNNNIDRE